MKENWIYGKREVYVLKMREVVEDVTGALVMGGHEEVQNIPVELREHFGMFKADLRIHENKVEVNYNLPEKKIRFHCNLREHMDLLHGRMELPEPSKYMEKN